MEIGVLKETRHDEHRVALTPTEARRLKTEGHRLFLETGAGKAARFDDSEYTDAGAEIVYGREEILRRGRLLLGVGALSPEDLAVLEPGQTLFAFLHLATASKEYVRTLLEKKITAVGYELIQGADGGVPVLSAIGELAGKMVVHVAAHLLQAGQGGRGILLGASAGAPPAQALILGAGTVGRSAARLLVATGAHVILVDSDREHLHAAEKELGGRLETFEADPETVRRFTAVSDVVIGAIRIPGERAPYLVTREMVAGMRPGSVIIDVAIDQGGCVESSRPTTLSQPTFQVNDVVHYCVPNLTADIPRTASKILSQAHLPYVQEVARSGVDEACGRIPGLKAGIYVRNGKIELPELAEQAG